MKKADRLNPTAEIAEHRIIEIIQKHLTPMPDIAVPFGDDVSAVPLFGGETAVLKTDMLVGATDVPPGMSLFAAARKAVVMNISDFASKGVLPSAVMVALGLPENLANEKAVAEIAEGLNAGAREYGAYVVGGDTNQTSDLIISVSLFGLARNALMLRSGAKAGDVLAVTGLFGKTAAGLQMLLHGGNASTTVRHALEDAVFNPKARLREGLALRGYDYVSASIDSSDGLAWSIHELARMSKVGFTIDRIPIAPEAQEYGLENGLDPKELALYGGEEYELVLTVKPEKWADAQALVQAVDGCLIPIGKVTYKKHIVWEENGVKHAIEPRGWEHFRSQV